MSDGRSSSVSTHVLDTGRGRPAPGIAVGVSVRSGPDAAWSAHGTSATDADGRCKDLPVLPEGTTQVRLVLDTGTYFAARSTGHGDEGHTGSTGEAGACFFPEVAITFAVDPGEHYHVPLLLSPFGYSVYRGS